MGAALELATPHAQTHGGGVYVRATKAQVTALGALLGRLDVDARLRILVREDPRKGSVRGALEVSLRDHWSGSMVSIDRAGQITNADAASLREQIPGQLQI